MIAKLLRWIKGLLKFIKGLFMKNEFNWNDLTDHKNEIQKTLDYYIYEAYNCSENYLSGCIMVGSAIECYFLILISNYPEKVTTTKKFRALQNSKNKKLLSKWGITDLITCVEQAELISKKENFNKLKKELEISKTFRNLVHPNALLNHFRELHENELEKSDFYNSIDGFSKGEGFKPSLTDVFKYKYYQSIKTLKKLDQAIDKKIWKLNI